MLMDLTRLRHIVAVADTGSFSRAAEEAHITQPALSRSIASFERQHGVRLFDRGRGGVVATPAGELVLGQARAMLTAAGDLERSLRLYGQGEAGKVTFGLGPMLGSLLLPHITPALMRERPRLRLSAVIRTPMNLLEELAAGRLEMIFGTSWQLEEPPATERRILGSLNLAVIARGAHPLAGARGLAPSELAAFPTASSTELPAGRLGDAAGAFICENFHILREVVAATDCIWRTSPAFVAEQLRSGEMTLLDVPEFSSAKTDICVLLPRGRTRSPAALELLEQVEYQLRQFA
jgi:LysR family transcriptional regulator, pca operon transcriptional activator